MVKSYGVGGWPVRLYCHLLGLGVGVLSISIPQSPIPVPSPSRLTINSCSSNTMIRLWNLDLGHLFDTQRYLATPTTKSY